MHCNRPPAPLGAGHRLTGTPSGGSLFLFFAAATNRANPGPVPLFQKSKRPRRSVRPCIRDSRFLLPFHPQTAPPPGTATTRCDLTTAFSIRQAWGCRWAWCDSQRISPPLQTSGQRKEPFLEYRNFICRWATTESPEQATSQSGESEKRFAGISGSSNYPAPGFVLSVSDYRAPECDDLGSAVLAIPSEKPRSFDSQHYLIHGRTSRWTYEKTLFCN